MIETLPRREREVFEILCRLETATAADVRRAMSGEPSDSAVRTLLSRLEAKELVRREPGRGGFVYRPAPRPDALAAGALKRMVDTFFAGSAASAATALLGMSDRLTPDEAESLRRLIDKTRTDGDKGDGK